MSRAEIVSVAELQQEQEPIQAGVVSLRWKLGLPEQADANQIGVNIRNIGNMASWAGLNALTVGGFQSEDLRINPMISSVDNNGNATATTNGITSASLAFQVHATSGKKTDVFFGRGREAGFLEVDTNKVARKITDSKQSLWSLNAWATQLDLTMRQGLRELATETIIRHKTGKDIMVNIGALAVIDAGLSFFCVLARRRFVWHSGWALDQ